MVLTSLNFLYQKYHGVRVNNLAPLASVLCPDMVEADGLDAPSWLDANVASMLDALCEYMPIITKTSNMPLKLITILCNDIIALSHCTPSDNDELLVENTRGAPHSSRDNANVCQATGTYTLNSPAPLPNPRLTRCRRQCCKRQVHIPEAPAVTEILAQELGRIR